MARLLFCYTMRQVTTGAGESALVRKRDQYDANVEKNQWEKLTPPKPEKKGASGVTAQMGENSTEPRVAAG